MPDKAMKDLSEIEIYFVLNTCGYMRWRLNHDAADGRPWVGTDVDKEIERLYNVQRDAANELVRFGINPLCEDGKTPSPAYWDWWYKWDGFVKSLSEIEHAKLIAKIDNGEDVSDYKLK